MSKKENLRPFHLAFPVDDLAAARHFYGDIMGCVEGRSSDHWIDFNFYGHQITTHLVERKSTAVAHGQVDKKSVPIPHFGIILTVEDWNELAARFADAGIEFVIKPYTRFKGETGEQSTMFLLDPAGNALEFKAFGDDSKIFVP